jgi:two-component system chemotaxis response regulator CheB
MDEIATDLIAKIKVAAKAKNKNGGLPRPSSALEAVEKIRTQKKQPRSRQEPTKIVAIGVSTGGPNALQFVLSQLPGDFPGSIVVVQHMPEGFTELFARRLDESCQIDVKEAQSGDILIAGRALICPGDRHIKIRRMALANTVVLSDDPRVNGHRPSVDVLFRSVAEFGSRAIAVLMTGMGDDGAAGMGVVKDSGGLTIAQAEDSCVVFGMPKAAIERGFATRVVALDALADSLSVHCNLERIARSVKV